MNLLNYFFNRYTLKEAIKSCVLSYFDTYHHLFKDFRGKKITFVEIVLDDGGHTNEQQILTAVNCISNINDKGILVTEDTHTSYQMKFGNPSKYSFIEWAKII